MILWHPKRQYCRGGLFVPLFLFFLHPIKRPSVSCHLKHWNILKLPGPNKHDIFTVWNLETAKKTYHRLMLPSRCLKMLSHENQKVWDSLRVWHKMKQKVTCYAGVFFPMDFSKISGCRWQWVKFSGRITGEIWRKSIAWDKPWASCIPNSRWDWRDGGYSLDLYPRAPGCGFLSDSSSPPGWRMTFLGVGGSRTKPSFATGILGRGW